MKEWVPDQLPDALHGIAVPKLDGLCQRLSVLVQRVADRLEKFDLPLGKPSWKGIYLLVEKV